MQSNEVRIPKNNTDFDLSPTAPPCQYFKSSFARSLSLTTTTSGTKSLDIDINFGLTPFEISTVDDKDVFTVSSNNESPRSLTMSCGSLGAIKAARSLLFNAEEKNNNNNHNHPPADDHKNSNVWEQKPIQQQQQQQQQHYAEESQMTPPTPIIQQEEIFPIQNSPSNNNNDMEVLRLRKECQSLIEENRRLIGLSSNSEVDNRHVVLNGHSMTITGANTGKGSSNVEAVFLQTQIDTLNWQLKQVESSRQMYRAVTEEVSRFLDKCYRSLEAIHQQQQCQTTTTTIGRSKSVVQVSKNHDSDSSCSTSMSKTKSTSRARSSTNLIDAKYFCGNKVSDVTCDSYEQFRDFTWRRTPKTKQVTSNLEVNPEKLSNEAYRLLRTVQNLMNTQEPLLLNPTNAMPLPTLEPLIKNDEPFTRKSQSRESRLSIRSSTDDSVHSNATTTTTNSSSSLKTETDEEQHSSHDQFPLTTNIPNITTTQHHQQQQHNNHLERIKDGILSSIDDESGFSSMNSFQEIGLPLVNSTMRSMSSSASSSSASSSESSTTEMENTAIENNRNSTLVQEKLGLPRIAHRRWDSAPVTNAKLQLSNAEDSLRVLWV